VGFAQLGRLLEGLVPCCQYGSCHLVVVQYDLHPEHVGQDRC